MPVFWIFDVLVLCLVKSIDKLDNSPVFFVSYVFP